MKFNYLLFLMSLSFWVGCASTDQQAQSTADMTHTEVAQVDGSSTERPPEVIPSDIDFNEILFDENMTWQDIDRYYREGLSQHEGAPYYSNLHNHVVVSLLSISNFLEVAPQENIAFYVEEILAMDLFSQPELTAQSLRALQGYWDEAKIQATARRAYQKTVETIRTDFGEEQAQRILERKQADLAELQQLAGK